MILEIPMDKLDKKPKADIDKVYETITSFHDPNIIADIFKQLNWNLSQEILETLSIVKQDVNLGAKLSAIRYLRKLLEEAAEQAGLIAKVSKTVSSDDGSSTTFSAKRIAAVLNNTKQVKSTVIESEEQSNGTKRTESAGVDRESIGAENQAGREITHEGRNRGAATTEGRRNGKSNRGLDSRTDGGRDSNTSDKRGRRGNEDTERYSFGQSSPCVKHRPPGRDTDLYPGISPGRNTESTGTEDE